jgi:hypothetical protein
LQCRNSFEIHTIERENPILQDKKPPRMEDSAYRQFVSYKGDNNPYDKAKKELVAFAEQLESHL